LNDDGVFITIQDALQFHPTEDDVGVINAAGDN